MAASVLTPGRLTDQVHGRCLVMGIVNITPDSFSDGGRFVDPEVAVAHGRGLAAAGADLLDVGGESTRPGAGRVPVEEELRRVLPVITELARQGLRVSVDTTRAEVAEQALAAGATMLNDVSGGLVDPRLPKLAAEAEVPYIAMHWRGPSSTMQSLARYGPAGVAATVRDDLQARADALLAAGIAAENLVLDPGIGFAKTGGHNWALLRALDTLVALGFPVLVGTSRKRFLGDLLAGVDEAGRPVPAPPAERDAATGATSALAAAAGAWGVRVHEVAGSIDAVKVAQAWVDAREPVDD